VPKSRHDEEEEESPTALDNALRELASSLDSWEPFESETSRSRKYKYYVICFDSEKNRARTVLPVSPTVIKEMIGTLFGLGMPMREISASESNAAEANLESVGESPQFTHDCAEAWRKAFGLPLEAQSKLALSELKGILRPYFPSTDSVDSVEWVRAARDGE
jgi:hypothetical protein